MLHFNLTDLDLLTICRAIGLVGFAIYVTGFFCLCVGKIDSTKPLYFMMVLVASSCVMISLWADFNLSAALIQGFYIMMSIRGIVLRRNQFGRVA